MIIAIIGRPNVGKSTFFNRIIGKKSAIVGNMPGITRDRKIENAELSDLVFDLVDTPGMDPFSKDYLAIAMNTQSTRAVEESHLVFFMIDAIEGVTEYDKAIALELRNIFKRIGNRPVVLIKNKSDGKNTIYDEEILGFGAGISISAEHNIGMIDLYQRISPYFLDKKFAETKKAEEEIKIAVIGRPNVGKSSLINAIIEKDRLLTGDKAGITRDSISLEYKFKNRSFLLMDTAGQRKKSRIIERVEGVAIADAMKHLRQANIALVLADIQSPLEKQDITIAKNAFDEGKVVIFALNKSDIVSNPDEILKLTKQRLSREFAQLPEVTCLLVSAKEKKGLVRIFNSALKLYDLWSKRITTGSLNKWLSRAIAQNRPPLVNGMPIKLKYIAQTNTRPPTFMLFSNRSKHLSASYKRYLLNDMRKNFKFDGIPLRIILKEQYNPYHQE
ncbi:MAG: ribosome biogenesis GTPase Der [Holosporaceae bacterium]|jgi:GTP-binding protein|nr:ribosome biogenesis GTPase Der [Holosporaceae bacterium]